MSAERFNKGKLRWDLVDWTSLEEVVKVLDFGAVKYSKDNWMKGLNREEILESTQRHLISLFQKETIDQESQLQHAAHVMCNMLFYLYHDRNNTFVEERSNPFTKTI